MPVKEQVRVQGTEARKVKGIEYLRDKDRELEKGGECAQLGSEKQRK